jgi:hypothetical protein
MLLTLAFFNFFPPPDHYVSEVLLISLGWETPGKGALLNS